MTDFISLFVAIALVVALYAGRHYVALRSNIYKAQCSGIPYVVVPIYLLHPLWIHSYWLVLPLLRTLPSFLQASWIEFIEPEWTWRSPYRPFDRLGTDIFLTVSPTQIVLWVADANCISQIVTRRSEFPKLTSSNPSQDLFSSNIASSEGSTWRRHRNVISPSFTEASNRDVWNETLITGTAMLEKWTADTPANRLAIRSLTEDTMKLSLRVISKVGFGVPLSRKFKQDTCEGGATSIAEPDDDVLEDFPHNTSWMLSLPHCILKLSPIKVVQNTSTSFDTWMEFVTGMLQLRREELQSDRIREGMDLMGCLLKGGQASKRSEGRIDPTNFPDGDVPLREAEITGNAFVFLLAGHETVASSLHLCILYLALDPSLQRKLQCDLDTIFGHRPVSEWNYERDMPKLLDSTAAAVMNEQLRLTPAVVNINKCTQGRQRVPLKFDGRDVSVPGGAIIKLVSVAVHRNPKYWPSAPERQTSDFFAKTCDGARDLDCFSPERWFVPQNKQRDGAYPQNNTPPPKKLFHPEKGAFIPFSEGPRGCLGRRFAQTEVLTLLSLVFHTYSVELAVDDFVSGREFKQLDSQARKDVWMKAAQRARVLMSEGVTTYPTLRLNQGSVAVRFVKRGAEVFG